MKTSYSLLAVLLVVTLTGMVATDALLKAQYEKVDWNNSYQTFVRRDLSTTKNLVIDGTPIAEIVIEQGKTAQALVEPEWAKHLRVRQQNDTTYVTFTPDYEGTRIPGNDADNELRNYLVLRLPDLRHLSVTDGRVTVRKRTASALSINLQNTRLRTNGLAVSGTVTLTQRAGSFAVLGADRYHSLNLTVHDSSGVQLADTQIDTFTPTLSPRAQVQLRGRSLRWVGGQ